MTERWQGPLFTLSPEGTREGQVDGSEAMISRTEDSMEFSITTSGLVSGGYTL